MKHPIYLKKLARPIGVSAGARVACSLPNGIDYLAAIIGCARLGALAVHINTRFRGGGRQSPAPLRRGPCWWRNGDSRRSISRRFSLR
jgi:acyl-CoA synthetase (AMP-forming)/AMP-acid ligase II